jgi:hypothetical protein
MSAAEITRFDTLMRLSRCEIRIADAMDLLGLQRRQSYRLLYRLRQEGVAGIVSRKRGRPSNLRFSDEATTEAASRPCWNSTVNAMASRSGASSKTVGILQMEGDKPKRRRPQRDPQPSRSDITPGTLRLFD